MYSNNSSNRANKGTVQNPEVIFWEPINARETNGKRMLAAGLDFAQSIMNRKTWAASFLRQWEAIETAAQELGCLDLLHIWADSELEGYVDSDPLSYWWYRATAEKWNGVQPAKTSGRVALSKAHVQLSLNSAG